MKTLVSFCRMSCIIFGLQLLGSPSVYAQLDTTTIENDTYGKGGVKIKVKGSDNYFSKIDRVEIRDAKKIVREVHQTLVFQDGHKTETDVFRDCDGHETYKKEVQHDAAGNETFFLEERRNPGHINSLISRFEKAIDVDGKKTVKRYNKETGDMEDVKDGVSFTETPFVPNTTSCPLPFIKNQVFAGFGLIREDSKPESFNTIGADLVFEHFFPNGLGYTAEAAITTGSSGGFDYNKEVVLVGAVARLLNKAGQNKISANGHLLAGVSIIGSSMGTYKNTSEHFTAELGVNVDLALGKNFGWRIIQADYLPTFGSGKVQNNVKVSTGFVLKMHSKIEERQTIE